MNHKNYFRVLNLLYDHPWAIQPEWLEKLIARVEDRNVDLEAVAAQLGRPLENTGGQVTMRGQTAVLEITGPIFRYANVMTALSGATSVEMAAIAFNEAVTNSRVEQIVLQVNSPGGEVDGINSFADQIREGARQKPVIAFVDGTGASAAYWLSSAASRIVADESALIGSIGVVASITDRSGAQERQGVRTYKFISSQSPRKQLSPDSEAGRGELQAMVDAMAELFIQKVAAFRGITPEQVQSDYGAGALLTAAQAKAAGMIDSISGFEPFLASLKPPGQFFLAATAATSQEVSVMDPATLPASTAAPPPSLSTPTYNVTTTTTTGGTPKPEPTPTPPPAPAPEPDPEPERARIRSILTAPEAEGRDALARTLAFDTVLDAATARKILAAAPAQAATTNQFADAMSRIPNPQVGVSNGSQDDSAAAEAARVLAFVSKERKIS